MPTYRALRHIKCNGQEFQPGEMFAPELPLAPEGISALLECGALEACQEAPPPDRAGERAAEQAATPRRRGR